MTVFGELNTLESAGLIRLAQWEPELEYLFRHALVQEAAYASLLTADRKLLHRAVGEAIERLYSKRLDDYAGVLAGHFEQAGDDQHALRYFLHAGRAALASFANQEAEAHYRSALALTELCSPKAEGLRPEGVPKAEGLSSPSDRRLEGQRAEALANLGEALYGQSRFHDAIAEWKEGIALHGCLENVDGMARLYARSARAAWYAGVPPEGLRLCEQGLEAVTGAPDSPAVALLIHEAGRACHFNGQPDKALPLCRRALEMARRVGAVDVEADALTTLGILPRLPAQEALAALGQAVQLAESVGLLQIAARAHHNLGTMTKTLLMDLPAARQHFLRAAELAHRRAAASEEFMSTVGAVGISIELGEMRTAQAGIEELERLLPTIPDAAGSELEIRLLRAVVMWSTGQRQEALSLHRLSMAEARKRGDLQSLANSCTELAWLLIELHRESQLSSTDDRSEGQAVDWSEAEEALGEAINTAERGIGEIAWPLCELAVVRVFQGDLDEARRLVAMARARSVPQHAAWNEISFATAEAYLAQAEGRWEAAMANVELVAERWGKMGRRLSWARALEEWAGMHADRGELADLERAEELLRQARQTFVELGLDAMAGRAEERLRKLQARIFAQALASGKAAQELAVAKHVQEGLLPQAPPHIPGWQIAARLEPARETSGDFYDFIPLAGGCWGLVIADVADKGAGAALFMALSRTLIRAGADRHPEQPELALGEANRHILADTHTGLFVTAFYGLLDPAAGTLTYCNAGQHPPYLLRAAGAGETLDRTGLPLGILEEERWEQRRITLAPGDMLLLYSDGVSDATTSDGSRYGRPRLLRTATSHLGQTAEEVLQAVLDDVHAFVGSAPQLDDVTLMVLARG